MNPDIYGRAVVLSTQNGNDVYAVNDGAGTIFNISMVTGTDVDIVYGIINSMAPANYVAPIPTDGNGNS
jgi:hypothetical protein